MKEKSNFFKESKMPERKVQFLLRKEKMLERKEQFLLRKEQMLERKEQMPERICQFPQEIEKT